jgi:hypothetical protein
MRRKLSLASGVAIAFLCAGLSLARDDRKDWQRTSIHLSELDYTLEDAAVTPRERAQIMDLIVAPYLERQAFSASPVGFINVSDDESKQIIVRCPARGCGGTGNCEFWVLVRESGRLKLVLEENGWGLIVRQGTHGGFHDVAVPHHLSARDTVFSVYQFNGTAYRRVDCYVATFPDHPQNAPAIRDCPAGH